MNPQWRPSAVRMRKPIVKRNSAQFAAICDALLLRGANIRFRANGLSMRPNILNEDAVTIAPVEQESLRRGDVALTCGKDGFRVHRVAGADKATGSLVTRADAGQENDATTDRVLGKVIAIERNGRTYSYAAASQRYVHACRSFAYRLTQAAALRAARFASASALFGLAILLGILSSAAPAAAQTDLAVSSDTAAPTTVAPGGQITYTVVVINNGPNTANVPVVTMNTPTGTTYVSAAKSGGAGTWNLTSPGVGGTGAITFTRTANMGNGSTTTFSFVVQVNAATTNGTVITQSVNISSTTTDPTPANNTATANVTVQTPDISVTNTDAPDPVGVASNITYTQVVTNNSATIAAVGATLSETTPTNTTYQ